MSKTFKQDPEKYAEMAVPFDSEAEAGAAIGAFLEKVTQLRESYRIAEVVVSVGVYVTSDDPDSLRGLTTYQTFGNLTRSFQLADAAAVGLARDLARKVAGDPKDAEPAEFALTPEPVEEKDA